MKRVPLLHYTKYGSGSTVVLLHGFMLSSQYWEKVTGLLAKRYQVIALDLLGFGKSPKPRRSRYDYDAQLRSLNATLKHIGVSEPFILVGHSMGSLLSLRYATLYPNRVRHLVLMNMPILLSPWETKREIFGTKPLYRLGLTPGTHQAIWTLFRALSYWRLLPDALAEELGNRTNYLFQSSAAARLRSFRNVIVNAKVEADLRAVAVKTVLISGLNDRALYLHNLANLMLGSNVVSRVIEGDHHVPLRQPNVLVQLLQDVA